MLLTRLLLAAACAAGPAAGAVPAAPIPLFNTGVAAPGALATGGTADPHYALVASPFGPQPAVVAAAVPGNYAGNGPDSQWIGTRADLTVNITGGTYVYRTTFDLTGLDPATAVIAGRALHDDGLVVFLNGAGTGVSLGGFVPNTFDPFTIAGGFAAGVNTLDFVVTNNPPQGEHGLRVELAGTAAPAPAAVPEPATLAVIGLLGAGGLIARRRSA